MLNIKNGKFLLFIKLVLTRTLPFIHSIYIEFIAILCAIVVNMLI